MKRNIAISTDVYAAIWACRKEGQENEDSILRDVLGLVAQKNSVDMGISSDQSKIGGVYDSRNDAYFPNNLVIYRIYKKQRFYAIVQNGVWVRRDTRASYSSLNQLNASIVTGAENVWGSWMYKNESGKICSINRFRDNK